MKGVQFSMAGIRKGYLFYQKRYTDTRVRVWTLGRSLPVLNFVECSPPLPPGTTTTFVLSFTLIGTTLVKIGDRKFLACQCLDASRRDFLVLVVYLTNVVHFYCEGLFQFIFHPTFRFFPAKNLP